MLSHPATYVAASALAASMAMPSAAATQLPDPIMPTVARGQFSAWPLGLVELGDDQVRLKGPGDAVNPPAPWAAPAGTAPNRPFSLDELFPTLVGGPGEMPVIDAMSTGNGVIPRHSGNGAPAVGSASLNWMALTLSVRNQNKGRNNSIVRSEYLKYAGNSGASLFTYYFDGSINILPEIVDRTALEAGRKHLGYPNSSTADVDALDYGVGLMTYDVAALSTMLVRETDLFFFSVTPTWATNNPAPFGRDKTTLAKMPPHPGDVYVLEWTGTAWGEPLIHRYADQMHWATWNGNDSAFNIDMLCVDTQNDTIIYSTDVEEPYLSQLMIHQAPDNFGSNGYPSEILMVSDGSNLDEVRKKAGLGNNDNVTGGCAFDPEGTERPTLGGIASRSTTTWQKQMGMSVIRSHPNALPAGSVHLQVTGWGALDPTTLGTTAVVFFSQPVGGGPVTNHGWVPRLPGEAAEITLTNMTSQGTGVAEFSAIMIDLNTLGVIGQTWTTELRFL